MSGIQTPVAILGFLVLGAMGRAIRERRDLQKAMAFPGYHPEPCCYSEFETHSDAIKHIYRAQEKRHDSFEIWKVNEKFYAVTNAAIASCECFMAGVMVTRVDDMGFAEDKDGNDIGEIDRLGRIAPHSYLPMLQVR